MSAAIAKGAHRRLVIPNGDGPEFQRRLCRERPAHKTRTAANLTPASQGMQQKLRQEPPTSKPKPRD
jgi:hypothetical protein